MHATDLLAQQHEEVSDLLEQVRDASGRERGQLLGRIAEALTIHALIEEQYLYPLIRRHGFPEAVDESLREHDALREVMGELLNRKTDDPEVELLLDKLELAQRDHVDKEESELFPWARARIPDEALEAAGEAMARASEEIWQLGLLEYIERRAVGGRPTLSVEPQGRA